MDELPLETPSPRARGQLYELFMATLAMLALGALAAEVLLPIGEDVAEIIQGLDLLACAVFLLDFLKRLVLAESKTRYFFKEFGFIDLLSSIPTIDALRFTRALRVLKVVRAFKGSRILLAFSADRTEGTFLTTGLVAILTLFFGAIAVLHAEQGSNTTIQTGEDALWWAFVTLTTVGYGDLVPVTTLGRIVAAGLMLVGLGLFGSFTGLVAAWLIDDESTKEEAQLQALAREVAALRMAMPTSSPGHPGPLPSEPASSTNVDDQATGPNTGKPLGET